MILQTITANALDLAGGQLIKETLDENFAVLVTLNVIDTMLLELANCGKQLTGYKAEIIVAANTNTGSAPTGFNPLVLDAKFIRWRMSSTDKWNILNIVDDISALTRKENNGEHAVCFQGVTSPFTYFLSWTPTEGITLEVWGPSVNTAEITDLNAATPPIPSEFSLLAAYRIADFCLNQLLLIDGKRYQGFVAAQKGSLKTERDRVEFLWKSYRFMPSDAGTLQKVRPYDIGQDYGQDDIETVLPSQHVS